MACSSSCQTQDHASYGECLRAKRLQVSNVEAHAHNQQLYKALDHYVTARRAGIQPDGVYQHQTDAALRETDRTGKPYRGDEVFTPTEE